MRTGPRFDVTCAIIRPISLDSAVISSRYIGVYTWLLPKSSNFPCITLNVTPVVQLTLFLAK